MEKVNKISPGLYEVTWISGGKSLAAIGITANGTRWLAPINWVVIITDPSNVYRAWVDVESVRRVKNG